MAKDFFRTRKMKKWSYFFPSDFLEKKISTLREDFNIKILSPEERKMRKMVIESKLKLIKKLKKVYSYI